MSYKIGDRVKMGKDVRIGEFCSIGDDCSLGDGCHLSDHVILCRGTIIEEGVFIGPSCVFFNDNYMRGERQIKPPLIKKKARIGGGSAVCQGVIIGENAMVGIGSLVVSNVPDEEMWFGRPAKRVRRVPREELR